MSRDNRTRRFSIYFLFLLAILAVIVMFGTAWLEQTAKELADKNPAPGTSLVENPALAVRTEAQDAPPDEAAPASEPDTRPKAAPSPNFEPYVPWAPNDPSIHKPLVEAMRSFFDLTVDAWIGRKDLQDTLLALADENKYPLEDLRLLRWLVAQSRSFGPALDDAATAKKLKREIVRDGALGFEIKGKRMWMHLREADASKQASLEGFPRKGPWPLLYAFVTADDMDSEAGPGATWLERTWPRDDHASLYRGWHVAMPLVKDAAYEGKHAAMAIAMRAAWTSLHVDFERVVLDGHDDALLYAVTQGRAFAAGLVLRGLDLQNDEIASKTLRDSLTNLARLPIYVVDKPDVAAALRTAGHKDVISGTDGAPLLAWMRSVHRKTPKAFRWHAGRPDQRMAHWINIDRLSEGDRHEVRTRIRGNTIDIQADGIQELSVFLDDDLVDLDKPVQVRINDHIVFEDHVIKPDVRETTRRDVRAYFEQPPVSVRKFRYYGWLKPASIVRLKVP